MLRLVVLCAISVAVLTAEIEQETEKIENAENTEQNENAEGLQKKSSGYCYSSGRILRNGQQTRVRHDPCAVYRCDRGSLRRVSQDCSAGGRCRKVGSTWTEKCATYKCERTRGRRGSQQIRVRKVSEKCVDAHGNCRQPGERFPHVVNGRYNSRCTCKQYRSRNTIRTSYHCQ
ncbi:hypothetical protein SNE40_019533 [Patella caerulea]|uniref:Uncharacterized protein n=1 Tax=Patella caerulea TaxID=87958 RepID=A0AAN8J6N1_PATCE